MTGNRFITASSLSCGWVLGGYAWSLTRSSGDSR